MDGPRLCRHPVRVRETVPDGALEMADEIELIDLPPDELVERLKQGKVYPADQVARALGSLRRSAGRDLVGQGKRQHHPL